MTVLLLALVFLSTEAAQSGSPKISTKTNKADMALGLFAGQPTGLTFRIGLGSRQDLEAKAAWNFDENAGYFAAQANWLIEFPGTLVIEKEDIIPYMGAGAGVGFSADSLYLGVRVPFGLVYRLSRFPLEFCLEVGLGIGVFPSTSFWSTGGLGIRYRFGAKN